MKPGKTGLTRICYAIGYSFNGLRAAWVFEAAFRQEVVLFIVLAPVAVLFPVEMAERLLMFFALTCLLITELLNSAVEAVVDRIGADHHDLSGRAKDMASAAVFIAIIQFVVIWTVILWPSG